MAITLTSRFCEVLTRYVEVKRGKIEKIIDPSDCHDEFDLTYGDNIVVMFDCETRNIHEEDCEEYDEDGDNFIIEDCKNCGNENTTFSASVRNRSECEVLEEFNWKKTDTMEMIKEKIYKFSNKTYQFCNCGIKAYKNGFCEFCYVYRYTRTEEEGGDCPICYSNDLRWVETSCKHTMCWGCYKKIKNEGGDRKCPLCRTVGKYTRDPYNK